MDYLPHLELPKSNYKDLQSLVVEPTNQPMWKNMRIVKLDEHFPHVFWINMKTYV